jgi:hypothetical protein
MIEVKTKRPIIYQGDLSELDKFIGADGNEYYCSADGEHFYNAKGEKVGGFFKKVGGGLVKGAKGVAKGAEAVGRVIKKASVAIVKASKTVAAGVKKVGGKAKAGATKLIHHKKKSSSDLKGLGAGLGTSGNKAPLAGLQGLAGLGLSPAQAAILGKSGKSPLPQGLAGLGLSPAQAAMFGKSGKSPLSMPQAKPTPTPSDGSDVFSLPLKKLTPIETQSMKPQDIVQVNGQTYSTQGIPAGKEVVVTQDDETGQEMVTVQYQPDEVVGVTGGDGNIEYFKKDDVGMNKALKLTLIIGGSVVVLGIIGYVIYRSSKKK